jgi:hypothetical protein
MKPSRARDGGLTDAGSVRLAMSDAGEKARRPAALEMVGDYHERELTALLEHVRDGFARLDAGELDELIHRYKRSARELWQCCNLGESAAWPIEDARNRGEELEWWAAVEPRRRR